MSRILEETEEGECEGARELARGRACGLAWTSGSSTSISGSVRWRAMLFVGCTSLAPRWRASRPAETASCSVPPQRTNGRAISLYKPATPPGRGEFLDGEVCAAAQTKAGHVLAGRRQCPTRCGSTQRRRVLVSYLVWLYVAQMSAGAHLDGQYLAV
jgi:hypothetical protein